VLEVISVVPSIALIATSDSDVTGTVVAVKLAELCPAGVGAVTGTVTMPLVD